ncbi:MAG: hypothetical protein J6D03_10030 [Clostridia bacterium]|nr:hypothetical protein [Clostridia bacterium]
MGILDLFLSNNSSDEFKVGDKVRVKYREQEGYIIDKDGMYYMVSMNDGELVDSYTADQLEKCW